MDQQTKQQIMDSARQMLDSGYHCSEGILLAAGTHYLGKVEPLALRMSTPFRGGVASTHAELCGALSGGIMLIGALYGRSDNQTNDDYCSKELARAFYDKFLEEFGWLHCQDLQDNWVGKPGQENCSLLVSKATGILIDILEKA